MENLQVWLVETFVPEIDSCQIHWTARKLITTDFDAGVLLLSATLPIGTKTFASGKYVAAHRRGILYGTTANCRAVLSPSEKWLMRSTCCPSLSPASRISM